MHQAREIDVRACGIRVARHGEMRPSIQISLFIASITAACAGGDGPALGGDLVGTWRILPNATEADPPPPEAERHTIDLRADGTYTETEGGGDTQSTSTGSYTIDNGELTITEDGETDSFSLPYLARDDRFVLGALLPDGSGDSAADTWTGTSRAGTETTTLTAELRADNPAHLNYDNAVRADDVFDGTWRQVNSDVEITLMPESNVTIHVRASLVDGVLGTAYEKI